MKSNFLDPQRIMPRIRTEANVKPNTKNIHNRWPVILMLHEISLSGHRSKYLHKEPHLCENWNNWWLMIWSEKFYSNWRDFFFRSSLVKLELSLTSITIDRAIYSRLWLVWRRKRFFKGVLRDVQREFVSEYLNDTLTSERFSPNLRSHFLVRGLLSQFDGHRDS